MSNLTILAAEIASAIICFILVKFMLKPFQLTRETRYLGLPIGFCFLGLSYASSALAHSPVFDMKMADQWFFQLFFRTFAFLFLAVTYFFSKSETIHRHIWNIVLAVITAIFSSLIVLMSIYRLSLGPQYVFADVSARVIILICIGFILFQILINHGVKPDRSTLIFPVGYILLGAGQYSQIFWSLDRSISAFWAGMALRLAGLAVFLFISYITFHSWKKREINENNISPR
jgi:hypothetical protein